MISRVIAVLCLLLGSLLLTAGWLQAETIPELKAEIESLVMQHYFSGIDYEQAHSLGPLAVLYLVKKLNNPENKKYRVNTLQEGICQKRQLYS